MPFFTVPDSVTKTPTQRATELFSLHHRQATSVMHQLLNQVIQSWQFVWNNQFGLTPQQAVDVIHEHAEDCGGSAAVVFGIHAATVAFLESTQTGIVPAAYQAIPAGYAYSVNPNGSLTITQT